MKGFTDDIKNVDESLLLQRLEESGEISSRMYRLTLTYSPISSNVTNTLADFSSNHLNNKKQKKSLPRYFCWEPSKRGSRGAAHAAKSQSIAF